MLTVDFTRLPIQPGTRLLDLGCGAGRHAFEAARRGAEVVALDTDHGELQQVSAIAAAMSEAGELQCPASITPAAGDATAMPFPDGRFDIVVAAEVLEHIPHDQRAISEIARVLTPGGIAAGTVPATWAGSALAAHGGGGLYWLAAAALAGIVGAVLNAWVLLIEIIR